VDCCPCDRCIICGEDNDGCKMCRWCTDCDTAELCPGCGNGEDCCAAWEICAQTTE
jgi:hypothetical protein